MPFYVGNLAVSKMYARGKEITAAYIGKTPVYSKTDVATLTSVLAWWDASDMTTLFQDAAGTIPVVSHGHPIGQLRDKKVGAHHLTTPDASRPLWQSDGSMLFDGIAMFLERVTHTLPTGNTPCEIWIKLRQDMPAALDTNTLVAFGWGGGTGALSRRLVRTVGAPNNSVNRGRASSGDGTASATATDLRTDLSLVHLMRGKYLPNGISISVDNRPEVFTPIAINTGTGRMRMGATSATTPTQFYKGKIAAAMVTQSPLIAADEITIKAYFAGVDIT